MRRRNNTSNRTASMRKMIAPPTAPPIVATELMSFLLPDKSCSVNVPDEEVVYGEVECVEYVCVDTLGYLVVVFAKAVDDCMGNSIGFKWSAFEADLPDTVVEKAEIAKFYTSLRFNWDIVK